MTDPKVEWSAEFTVPADDSKGLLGIKFEDSGNAAIMYLPEADPVERGGDGCFFVRLHSWDAAQKHSLFRSLMGRRVRVTIETIE